ncbi:nuclear pore complex protein NUP85 isoform X1 [Rhododendron vialii]|uniref:nuclear pore complex protein NUP85 isoform X1 n=1 Tax=Rhododendron vialii TaxID=182163 RepID=UPI00265E0191|nr:nuclear pore complex protein NUP85 isoform X1 [Rhododendron vialii]
MPGLTSDPGETSLVPFSSEVGPVVYPLRHGLKHPIAARFSISWSRGNSLRVSGFQSEADDGEVVRGKVVELKLGSGDGEIDHAQWRRIAYGSVSPFALLQSRKNSMAAVSKLSAVSSPYDAEWSDYVMEYSRDIGFLLGGHKLSLSVGIEDTKTVLKKVEEPTCLKAAWELMVIFYADHKSQAWTPEQLVDWLADYDSLLSGTQPTVHSKLVNFQKELTSLQAIEDDDKYWEAISSALAVGWLDVAVKMLRLHGSYQLNQVGSREIENGLVEAVAVLISKMPRMRLELAPRKFGECFGTKPDFIKAWEKWRGQISKLDCSAFWVQCDHRQTREGLKNLLQIMLGNANILSSATCHWMELHVSYLLHIRPFTMGLESMNNLAQKCMQFKPVSFPHKLMTLLLGILGENTEVVLAECSRSFGPWMVVHAAELLAAGNTQAEILLHEERHNLRGISMEELHRLVYAQVLSSHALTWQIAPIYLASCTKQGMALLKILLYKQPMHHNQILLKNIEICRLYELHKVSSKMMKIAGVHHWKHGKKGSGVFWLQQARDEIRLSTIAQQLFDFVGKSISEESFKQWEGLIELLGSESRIAGGLEFLHKYRDFKRSLQQVHDGIATNSAQKAAESLILLMKNPSTPQRFWLPLLYDSLKLLNWQEHPLLNVSQTNLLLNKLQELSIVARLRPDFTEADLPSQALSSVRLALATNLGRAILEE